MEIMYFSRLIPVYNGDQPTVFLATHLKISGQNVSLGNSHCKIISEKYSGVIKHIKLRKRVRMWNYTQAAVALSENGISGLAIFIMMFSILSMMNTLITNIVTRRQELAMLESIGMGKGQIRQMLLGESLLLVLAAVGATMTIVPILITLITMHRFAKDALVERLRSGENG